MAVRSVRKRDFKHGRLPGHVGHERMRRQCPTRTHEFKHFTPERSFEKTVVFREYSYAPQPGEDVYYPIRTPADLAIRAKYQAEAEQQPEVLFGGRLGAYAYLDMENTISSALDAFAQLRSRILAASVSSSPFPAAFFNGPIGPAIYHPSRQPTLQDIRPRS